MAVRLYNEYIKVDPNFIPVFSRNSDRTYPDKWQSFYPHTSFKNILKDVVETLEKSNETKDRSIWMSGAYGTGNRIDALSCLTCLTDVEQKTIFEIVAEFSYQQRKSVLSILKRVYPSLYYYLQNDEQPNCAGLSTEHEQYFSEYKWLKATDTLTEEFVSKVKRISLEKGASVFQMQSRNYFVSEHYDEHTSILFVDGMGIEYVDYLAHLLCGWLL